MMWEVYYSPEADRDLDNIFDYISDVLIEPVTAERFVERLMKAAESLDYMPFRHRIYDEEPWKSQGVRVFNIDKYMIFYKPDELHKTVKIISIMNGTVDITKHLPIEN